MGSLTEAARRAAAKHPDSDVELALDFLGTGCPEFVGTSNDRLVKVGRSVRNLVDMETELADKLEASLELVVEQCHLLLTGDIKVTRVPFGKTGLEMPIVTLGCMRFQQEWGPRITNMNMVGSDCQDNLVAILQQAIDYGMVHIETARAYGSSELQIGVALKQLFQISYVKREDLIIQTKVNASEDPADFRADLETSFRNLQVDYVDLFAIHGMNLEEHMDWVFGKDGNNCMAVVKEYMKAGKIRHVGFSTHGPTELIMRCIDTNAFDYVNLHYHYFGSYTDSGCGHDGHGNLDAVKLLHEKNMGTFIISPFDKGGQLYLPSRKLRCLTVPDMEPMDFGCNWIWNHHRLDEQRPQLHTFTAGAARPSDLDQPALNAYLHATQPDETLAKVQRVMTRLENAKVEALGEDWVANWYKGLPKAYQNKHSVEHNQIVWIHNCIKAFGMYSFATQRYKTFESQGAKWDDSLTPEENIEKVGKRGWGYMPGIPLRPNVDYSDDFVNVPAENLERVKEAEDFVYEWCRTKPAPRKEKEAETNGTASNGWKDERKIPREWETAYDMRPWPDYPEQPSRG